MSKLINIIKKAVYYVRICDEKFLQPPGFSSKIENAIKNAKEKGESY